MDNFHEGYCNKLKSRIFGLLCEREKNGEWEKFLDSILTELLGYNSEHNSINFYMLYAKLASLRYLRYEYFRKTIFDCMGLVSREDGLL